MLFLYQRDLGDSYRNRPPGVVWLDNLRDCLGNVRIPLARNPCGRRRLKNLGPGIVKFRYQRWLSLNTRIVIAFRRLCMPLFVFLSAVGLHTSGLEGVAACERQWRPAGGRWASSPCRWMLVVVLSTGFLLFEAVLLLLCLRPSSHRCLGWMACPTVRTDRGRCPRGGRRCQLCRGCRLVLRWFARGGR